MTNVDAPRMTRATRRVLRALLQNPGRAMCGLDICQAAGRPSGSIYPILARLERLGWLDSWWEVVDQNTEGRPRRRCYQLNPEGARQAHQALARSSETTMLRHPVMWLFGGYLRDVPGIGGVFYFATRRAAERYPTSFFGAIDPYLRRGIGPIQPIPGHLLRRTLGDDRG